MSLQTRSSKLQRYYPQNVLRSALIRFWAESNAIPLQMFREGSTTSEFLDGATANECTLAIQELKSIAGLQLKDVERFFESLIDTDRRQSLGTVYTPNYLIDYLVTTSLDMLIPASRACPVICDPSCGSGGFLVRSATILQDRLGIAPSQAFTHNLVGFDIDPWALKHAQCIIELYLASKGAALSGQQFHLLNRDSVLSNPTDLWDAGGVERGFDIVVTNPPYVKLQNLDVEYRTRLSEQYSSFAQGSFSLALLFLIAGHRLLHPEGVLALVTQNNLFTSLAGKFAREYLQQQRCIKRIIDFGHHKLFENASAYTCLIFMGTKQVDGFEYETFSTAQTVSKYTLNQANFSIIRYDLLDAEKWRLAKGKHLEHVLRIEDTGRPLGQVASIKVGFATLKDRVFFVRDNGSSCVATLPSGKLQPVERHITRPAIKVSELSAEDDLENKDQRRIIFPYRWLHGGYQLIPEDRLQHEFPLAYTYLSEWREELEKRDKGRKKYDAWYAWGRSQGMIAPGPKLLTKTFSRFPQFFLDNSDRIFCNGYAIFPGPATLFEPAIPIQVLQAILNSRIMYYYAKLSSFEIEGDYQCYQKNFIERFGIINLDDSACTALLDMNPEDRDVYLASLYGIPYTDIHEILC